MSRLTPKLVVVGLFLSLPLHGAGPSLHGSISNHYKARTTGAVEDHDLETIFTLDIGDARSDRLSGALQLGGVFDLNGNQSGSTFTGIYDSYTDRAEGRLYYAYMDARDLGPIQNLRAGRQHRYSLEALYFDGATLESDPFHGFTVSAFGGVPVHLFENQFGVDPGDWLLGGSLQWNPVSIFQARFDYVHLRDKVAGFRASAGNREDNLLGGTVWVDLDRHVSFTSRFTSFTDQVRDVSSGISLSIPERDFSLRFDFFRLLKGYDVRIIEWDAFGIAGTYQPYTEFSVSATKGVGDHLAIDGGFSTRFLDDNQISSAFNHGYDRAFLSLSTFDLPVRGLSLTATGDFYHGKDNSQKNNTVGGSFFAAQKLLDGHLKLSGGTAYYLYRYNLFAGNESSDVQTWFARVEGDILKNLKGQVGYEFEDNSFNNYHSADVKLIWSF